MMEAIGEAEVDARLMPAEWTGGETVWVVEAIGEPKVLRELLKRLAAKEWATLSENAVDDME